jgi:hypothetical protein
MNSEKIRLACLAAWNYQKFTCNLKFGIFLQNLAYCFDYPLLTLFDIFWRKQKPACCWQYALPGESRQERRKSPVQNFTNFFKKLQLESNYRTSKNPQIGGQFCPDQFQVWQHRRSQTTELWLMLDTFSKNNSVVWLLLCCHTWNWSGQNCPPIWGFFEVR